MRGSTASTKMRATVFVLDENSIMREGLVNIVDSQEEFEVCGASGDPHKAKKDILVKAPDLVTLDISLRSASGLGTIKHLRAHNSKIKILVLSELEEKLHAQRVLRAGANGYVMKTEQPERVVEAMKEVLGGDVYLSTSLKEEFAKRFVAGDALARNSVNDRLSQREFEVYSLLGQGHSPREIADELHLSVKTVQAYCTRIKDKLNLGNARELLQSAIHWDLEARKEFEGSSATNN